LPRILLSISVLGFLFASVIGSFAASGDARAIPQSTPGTLQLAKTETGTKTEEKQSPKLFIRKKYHVPDTYTDTTLLRFVSRSIPLADMGYIPAPLVSISGAHINQAGRSSQLRKDARDALWDLARAFEDEFKTPLVVISGYRSAAYQQRLWDLGRCTDSLCAPPWYSEHQLGLAIDVFDATNEDDFIANRNYKRYVTWFQGNAHIYGWHQSYQKGEAIDGYEVEPWHWRYIGVEMATKLKNLWWTYTEYVRFNDTMLGW
jgi:zinc D-Ala-D-Ala carboxypeptidase